MLYSPAGKTVEQLMVSHKGTSGDFLFGLNNLLGRGGGVFEPEISLFAMTKLMSMIVRVPATT